MSTPVNAVLSTTASAAVGTPGSTVPTPAAVRCCVVIPTYNNVGTVRGVAQEVRQYVADVIVVDDGSEPSAARECRLLEQEGLAQVHRLDRNRGKGAAVKAGFELARARGFTHVLQVDADGQHDSSFLPSFLAAAQASPQAAVLAYPEYDESAPSVRRWARKITDFWVALEVGRGVIRDAMIGFRIYPLSGLARVAVTGNRMDFDVEVAVRLAWAQVPIVNLPVRVRYLSKEEGGISHFRPLRDNLRLSVLHSRLCIERWFGWLLRPVGIVRQPPRSLDRG